MDRIKKAGEFGLSADGTTDVARQGQFSISTKYIDENFEANESFLGFYNCSDGSAATLTSAIVGVFVCLNIDLRKHLRDHCFDVASVMKGQFTGVQSRFKDICPQSEYVYYTNRSLDLVLQEVGTDIPPIGNALQFINQCANMTKESWKRRKQCEEIFGTEPVVYLPAICPTRWTVRTAVTSKGTACC